MLSRGTQEQRKVRGALLSLALWCSHSAWQRADEYSAKIKAVIVAEIGDRYKLMMQAPLVMTAPESQGRGYASALLREMIQLVGGQ